MAVATVTPAVSPAQLTVITSEEISRYAEITAQLSQLEAQQKALRTELLDLHKAGAEQETISPYLLGLCGPGTAHGGLEESCAATCNEALRLRKSRAVEAES